MNSISCVTGVRCASDHHIIIVNPSGSECNEHKYKLTTSITLIMYIYIMNKWLQRGPEVTVSCVLWHTHQFVFPSTLNLSPNSSLTLIQSFCVWCLTSTQPDPNSNKLSLWRLTKDLTPTWKSNGVGNTFSKLFIVETISEKFLALRLGYGSSTDPMLVLSQWHLKAEPF